MDERHFKEALDRWLTRSPPDEEEDVFLRSKREYEEAEQQRAKRNEQTTNRLRANKTGVEVV